MQTNSNPETWHLEIKMDKRCWVKCLGIKIYLNNFSHDLGLKFSKTVWRY